MHARHRILGLTTICLMGIGSVGGCAGATTTPPAASSAAPTAATATPASGSPSAYPTESSPAGDIPDDTVYLAYRPQGGAYEVRVPEGWARTDLPTGASFTDKLNSVKIETLAAASAPTEASARGEVPGVEITKIDTVTRKGGKAVRIIYRSDSAPDPVTGKVIRDVTERYEFYRSGREAVLTLTGPVGADNVDPWRTVSESFRWTP